MVQHTKYVVWFLCGLFSQDTTTPDYTDFEVYTDNNQEEDGYPVTDSGPEFQPSYAGGDQGVESLHPASPDARSYPSEDSDHQVSYGSEDVPLTSEPRYGSEAARRQYVPPNPPETVAEGGTWQTQEQQPQVTLVLFTPKEINILRNQPN